ncbi:hypothetical protein [Vibrio aquaticus]|nr:hypothetical protein [Vibrio aquaticus]
MQQATMLLDLWSMLEHILYAALGVFAFSAVTLMVDTNNSSH